MQIVLKDSINIILSCRRRLTNNLFNYNCEENTNVVLLNIVKEQINYLDLFYNVYIDNLYEEIKSIGTKQDLINFSQLYNNLFTINTLINMKISDTALQDIYDLQLSERAVTIVFNYCNMLTKLDKCIVTSYNYFITYTCRLLLVVYFMWNKYYEVFEDAIAKFNYAVKKYDIIVNKDTKFINLYSKIITQIKKPKEQEEIIALLRKLSNAYELCIK